MSGAGGGSEEKTLPPSAKKMRDARKKGQVARSKEMVTAVVTLAAFAYLFLRAGTVFANLQEGAIFAGAMADQPFAVGLGPLASLLGRQVLWTVAPLVGLLVLAAVLSNVAVNGGVLAALEPVLPKLERLDPVEGFKRLFSLRNLVELVKSVLKVALLGTVACLIVAGSVQALVEQPSCGVSCAGPLLLRLLRPLLLVAGGCFLVLGGLDIGLQRWLFGRDMRMTRTEQKREHRDMLGNPLIKQQHRQEQRAGLNRTVRAGLRNATFVVRSSELALAFRFAKPDAMVPVLVARGTAEGAPVLLEEARRARIPVVLDPAAATLFAPLKVGQMVGKEAFQTIIACMKQAGVM